MLLTSLLTCTLVPYALVPPCRYVDQEIRAPNNQLPPLEDGLALMTIRSEARRFKCATLTPA